MKTIHVCDLGTMSYPVALELQRRLLKQRQDDQIGDTLLIVEHPPVLTLGTRGDYANIYLPKEALAAEGVELFEVERGGDVTYHGPGQIVGYPIIKLSEFPGGIRGYIAAIAQSIIRLLQSDYGIVAEQRFDKYSGVWVGESKIVAIGVAVKSGVTLHGFAFNVNTNLRHFEWINPCGLSKGVTSVEHELGEPADLARIKEQVIDYLCAGFAMQPQRLTLDELERI